MNPDDKQSPIDYLNQIAPQAPKKMLFSLSKRNVAIFGGIIIVIIIVIATLASSLSGGINQTERLAARLLSTQAIMDDATSKIKTTQLRTLNGNLKIYLTNTIRDIGPILTADKIDITKLNSKVLAAESNTKVLAILEEARLNVMYDRTYAREMSYKLDTVLTLMKQIQNSTKNMKLKTFLQDAYDNLQPTQQQFADFDAANS